ncbi:hypothetical protein KBD18_00695 [Patescibacteria group bacterium]|nr:hypothetical protein [Patescibacteria group bacterium]
MANKRPAAQNTRLHRLERNQMSGLGGDFSPAVIPSEEAEPIIPLLTKELADAEGFSGQQSVADSSDVGGETEDVTLPWEQWEHDHAEKRRRLVVIVALAMAGIVGVWAFSVSGTIAALRVAGSANSESARAGFLERFSDYQKRLDALSAQAAATSTPAATTTTVTDANFVESLKTHATEAAAAPIAPAPSTP